MRSLFTIVLSVGLFIAYMTILPPYLSGTDKLLNSGTIDSKGDQSINSGRHYQQLLGGSLFDSNEIVQTNRNNTYSQPTFIIDNQSGSGLVALKSGSFWKDSLNFCNSIFKCYSSHEGWKNTSSISVSTKYNHLNTQLKLDGKSSAVKNNEKYQVVTHVKLNKFVKQSQITVEGFNYSSKKWYVVAKCPYPVDGPLDWKEFSCVLTVENSTTMIRPVLNPGWSSQLGKEAVSWFGPIYLVKLGNPFVTDPNLRIQVVARGLDQPTSVAFLTPNRILFLEKSKGTVKEIVNGTVLSEPLLDVNVANDYEMGMLGLAVQKNMSAFNKGSGQQQTFVFLYFTEADEKDGGAILGNRLYRYELRDNKLVNPLFLWQSPAGVQHDGGKVLLGPDKYLYLVVGEVDNKSELYKQDEKNMATNYMGQDEAEPDGRAGVLRFDQNGRTVGAGILGSSKPLDRYYAYGIRNSFGIDFDPITSNLWDTENGPEYADEINLIKPGFNSGWSKVQGIWKPVEGDPILDLVAGDKILDPKKLVDFGGKGKYSPPEFIWNRTVGPTAIKFLNSDKLGSPYQNDVFVGDINNGNVYHFDLNANRTSLLLQGPLNDTIADNYGELDSVVFAGGLNHSGITDLQVGPDGYLYVVSFGRGEIYRIMPNDVRYNILEDLDKLASNEAVYSTKELYDTGEGISTKGCIHYDSTTSTIMVTCKSTDFAELSDVLKNPYLLGKERLNDWILNANLEINSGSTFYVNSSTANLLKINSTGGIGHSIHSHGNLIIDSVKILGWDTSKNKYATTGDGGDIPRSHILVDKDAGTTKITNSEIAYLGYNNSEGFGLVSYSHAGIILGKNKIHNLYYGLKSVENLNQNTIEENEIYNNSKHGMYLQGHDISIKGNNVHGNGDKGIICSTDCYNIVFESNKVYDNSKEGMYLQGHDISIKDNKVHGNGDQGIICTTDCYSVIVDSNKVYDNSKEGIILYKNISNSIIRNNNLFDNKEQLAIYQSSNSNTISNNNISGGKVGIRVSNSSQNLIHDNNLMNSIYGIYILNGASNNEIISNKITNTSDTGILIQGSHTNGNIFKNNILRDSHKNEVNKIGENNSNLFVNNTFGISPKN